MSEISSSNTVLLKSEQRSILLHGLLVFFVTGVFALAAGTKLIVKGGYAPSAILAVPYALAFVAFATALLLLALRTFKHPIVFESLFAFTTLVGVWFLADIYLPPGLALLAGSLVILLRFAWKTVVSANLCLAIGVAGIAASFASSLSPTSVLALLTVLSFYDIVAVYGTKHMVGMFRGLASRGAVFAFALTPLTPGSLLSRPAADGRGAMWLGIGDVALPALLAVSALRVGAVPAVSALAGAMFGFILMFKLSLSRSHHAPRPALPPIALGAGLAYLASLIVSSS